MTQTPNTITDRRCDASQRDSARPPILGRPTQWLLCVGFIAVVLYGTLGPLGTQAGHWLVRPESFAWLPPATHLDRNDVLTNFWVYVPMGLGLRLVLRRRGGSDALDLLASFAVAAGLSYATELLQQFMPQRSSSRVDLLVNTAGALCGAVLAPLLQRRLRRDHAAAFGHWDGCLWTILAWAAVDLTAVLMTIPWNFVAPHFEWRLLRGLDMVDVQRYGVFAITGFCIAASLLRRRKDSAGALRRASTAIVALAVGLEGAQCVIAAHSAELLDTLIAAVGGLSGVAVLWACWRLGLVCLGERPVHPGDPSLTDSQRLGAWLVLATASLGAVIAGLAEPALYQSAVFDPHVRWTPFSAHFLLPLHHQVAAVIEPVAMYAFIAFVALALAPTGGLPISLLLVTGLVTAIETARAFVYGGAADVTALLLAWIGWIVAAKFWKATQPRSTPPAPAVEPAPLVPSG